MTLTYLVSNSESRHIQQRFAGFTASEHYAYA